MIYEVRTYTLRPGTLAEFEERYAKRLPAPGLPPIPVSSIPASIDQTMIPERAK